MISGGQNGPSAAVVVYGPDGTAYGSPAQARAAGVENYSMQQPVGGQMLPGFGGASPMTQYQMPDLAARAPEFGGYGYQAPSMAMVQAPNQMPRMGMDPNAIYDPSVEAAMQILNQPMMVGQMPNMMGSGTEYQQQFGLLPNIAATQMPRPAMPQTPSQGLIGMVAGGGGGGGGNYYGGDGRGGSDLYAYDPQRDAQSGGSRAQSWVGLPADMIRDSGDNSLDSQRDDQSGGSRGESWQSVPADMRGDGASDGVGSKIVCTAMNQAYGFGSFRNRIWLAYAAKNLTKAHEAGYHALFLPLVAVGYNQGDKMHNRIVRRVLENIARHRSADLRAEMRNGKRDRVGQAYRFILEPLCYAVGKLKGK